MTNVIRLSTGIALVLGLSFMTIATSGSQPGMEEDRLTCFETENRATKFQTTDQIFPSRIVRAGTDVWKLESASLPDDVEFSYEWDGEVYNVDEFNERTNTSPLLILKDGKILT